MAYSKILVAVSGAEEDRALLRKASELAGCSRAQLTALHIDGGLSELYPGVYSRLSGEILSGLKNARDRRLAEIVQGQENMALRIEQGYLPDTLLQVLQEEEFDLLICGHHHSFISRLMPAYRLIADKSPVDLLIVPIPGS